MDMFYYPLISFYKASVVLQFLSKILGLFQYTVKTLFNFFVVNFIFAFKKNQHKAMAQTKIYCINLRMETILNF